MKRTFPTEKSKHYNLTPLDLFLYRLKGLWFQGGCITSASSYDQCITAKKQKQAQVRCLMCLQNRAVFKISYEESAPESGNSNHNNRGPNLLRHCDVVSVCQTCLLCHCLRACSSLSCFGFVTAESTQYCLACQRLVDDANAKCVRCGTHLDAKEDDNKNDNKDNDTPYVVCSARNKYCMRCFRSKRRESKQQPKHQSPKHHTYDELTHEMEVQDLQLKQVHPPLTSFLTLPVARAIESITSLLPLYAASKLTTDHVTLDFRSLELRIMDIIFEYQQDCNNQATLLMSD